MFAGTLEGPGIPDYRLEATYPDGTAAAADDRYRPGLTSGRWTCTCWPRAGTRGWRATGGARCACIRACPARSFAVWVRRARVGPGRGRLQRLGSPPAPECGRWAAGGRGGYFLSVLVPARGQVQVVSQHGQVSLGPLPGPPLPPTLGGDGQHLSPTHRALQCRGGWGQSAALGGHPPAACPGIDLRGHWGWRGARRPGRLAAGARAPLTHRGAAEVLPWATWPTAASPTWSSCR